MRSLLARSTPLTPVSTLPGCGPGRQEKTITIRKAGRLVRVVVRDRIVVEDPYLVAVKAAAFALGQGTAYVLEATPRSMRDFLIKSNVGII